MTAPPTAVVVVNHNTRDHLRSCLESVLAEGPAATVVVDTASRDGSADLVRSAFPTVELVETENRGYGAAANTGLARIETPYALLLNADTRLEAGTLRALTSYLVEHPPAALVGPFVVDQSGAPQPTARNLPTPLEVLLQESGLHRILRRPARSGEPRRVDWILGAALALRSSAVAAVGGFDESYYMYNEEVDLCLRLRRAGWEIHYVPVATVAHAGGASTMQYRPAMAAQYVRSTMRLYTEHFPGPRRTQLRLVLGAALASRLLRDGTRLALTRAPDSRAKLEKEVGVWREALAALAASQRE